MGHRGRKSIAELHAISIARNASAPRSTATDTPPAPAHLSAETKTWWDMVLSEHELETHQLRTLQVAYEAWDLKERARRAVAEPGLSYVANKNMVRARREVTIERDSRIAYLRAVRELHLTIEPPANSGLQPAALYR